MTIKSTRTRYGTVAVMIHWISALMIITMLVTGFLAANTLDPGTRALLLTLHAPVGIAVLVMTLARIGWWRFADKRPQPVAGSSRWQELSARAVHLLFYIVIIGMATSGIGLMALSGAGSILFAGAPGPLPDFQGLPPRAPHGAGARVMILLLLIHAGAALHHQLVRKDRLLNRMWLRDAE